VGHSHRLDGIKVSDRGEWLRESWRVCRGWIKVHVAVEVSSKRVVEIEVSDEREADHLFLPSLVGQTRTMFEGRIARVLADAAYDTHANFVFLRGEGIEAGIRIKRNASWKGRGSFARPLAVMERNRLGEAGWKERYGYGRRWNCESAFSAVKRIFGERVRSRRRENAFNEVRPMFSAYNRLLGVDGGLIRSNGTSQHNGSPLKGSEALQYSVIVILRLETPKKNTS
jgi:hypothetical protein